MFKPNTLLAFVFTLWASCFAWVVPVAARVLNDGNPDGFSATVEDGCSRRMRMHIHAPDKKMFQGDRIALQRFLGMVRGGLEYDCPTIRILDIEGISGGTTILQETIMQEDEWKLPAHGTLTETATQVSSENLFVPAPVPKPIIKFETARCGIDANNPMVGCWYQIIPTRLFGNILNIKPDTSFYAGSPQELSSGRSSQSGVRIRRGYMHLHGDVAEVFSTPNRFSLVTGPIFASGCDVMSLLPYQPFGLPINDGEETAFIRLRVGQHIVAGMGSPSFIFSDELYAKKTDTIDVIGHDDPFEFHPNTCVNTDASLSAKERALRASEFIPRFVSLGPKKFLGLRHKNARKFLPGGSLAASRLLGGHTQQHHIGLTNKRLAERLKKNRKLKASSTFRSKLEAEIAIGEAMRENKLKIRNWVRSTRKKDLPIESRFRGGRVLKRKSKNIYISDHIIVILTKNESGVGYYIKTAYPALKD